MKRNIFKVTFIFLLLLSVLSITNVSHANMAAPDISDVGTGITFEKNDSISVLSETLNIKVNNDIASIEAIYEMRNTENGIVTTKSMFISPNIASSDVIVKFNDKYLEYETKDYYATPDIKITTNDWQYIVFYENEDSYSTTLIQTVTFDLLFQALEVATIKVKYDYRLGGRPSRNDNYRYGEMFYYLAPANNWKNFSDLTINLELCDSMPVLKESNLNFIEVDNRKYQYKSNELPNSNLKIEIGLTKWQSFTLQFRNPYFWMNVLIFLPIFGIPIAIILVVILVLILTRNKKKTK